MSETLLAILLVTSSAGGSSLVYRWPPHPQARPRLCRPRPTADGALTDNPWRAANLTDEYADIPRLSQPEIDDDEYFWTRPKRRRERSMSFSHSRSHPTSRRSSPSKDPNNSFTMDDSAECLETDDEEYCQVLGYSAKFLANLLCPHKAMCHQRFELVVDDLAFIGHPVCADSDGSWKFKQEKVKMAPRGRGSKKGQSPQGEELSLTPDKASREKRSQIEHNWLETFHLVLVLDLPDPSSSASGNTEKYFETIYEHVAFMVTAVLYQEQILYNFVEAECDILNTLESEYVDKEKPFEDFVVDAVSKSSIASTMKTLFEAIKQKTIARLVINDFSFEVQLPPYLDELLHDYEQSELEYEEPEPEDEFPSDEVQPWGADVGFAWRLPTLTPWKSLLRLDNGEQSYELYLKLRGPHLASEDRELAEQLMKFLDLASVTLCLADMASLLDWDLETQVYPTVRWLVLHRRAKLIDAVHPGLKTVFSVPPKLPSPLAQLSEEFACTFDTTTVPPLPKLLSQLTTTTYEQTANHFYASVVRSKDLISLYVEVVVWLLKHDLLVTLHLRIRIVATTDIKRRVAARRRADLAKRNKGGNSSAEDDRDGKGEGISSSVEGKDIPVSSSLVTESSPGDYWVSMSPKSARRQARQLSPERRTSSMVRAINTGEREDKHPSGQDSEKDEEDEGTTDVSDDTSSQYDFFYDDYRETVICEPGRATLMEIKWLEEMSRDKDEHIKKQFQRINQYFNGKCTDDEILYRADITRKQLREVLHHYEDYLQTFLHAG
ncbi:hypothetical protein K474DRAFT_915248 [Panus rudis PR-1116 ss-1]|nr:hypothetical protein K474DRAFT_915248 [Panus rudis PR-1116 ss-1]